MKTIVEVLKQQKKFDEEIRVRDSLHYDPKQSECYCVDCFFEILRGESNDDNA